MNRLHYIRHKWLPALTLLCCVPGLAATVYKTVDADGVVSYSDIKPADGAPMETLVIDARTPEVTESEQQRLQDMRDTTDRMAADRMGREKHRAELRQLQAQSQPQYQPQADYNPGYTSYSSGYSGRYNYPRRRPWIPGPRPEHPIARPPLRLPVQRDHAAIRTSLPGNNYPASLIRRSYDPKVRAAMRN